MNRFTTSELEMKRTLNLSIEVTAQRLNIFIAIKALRHKVLQKILNRLLFIITHIIKYKNTLYSVNLSLVPLSGLMAEQLPNESTIEHLRKTLLFETN